MVRCSDISVAEILSSTNVLLLDENDSDKNLALMERKIAITTEGFTTYKFCELILKVGNRLSKEMH